MGLSQLLETCRLSAAGSVDGSPYYDANGVSCMTASWIALASPTGNDSKRSRSRQGTRVRKPKKAAPVEEGAGAMTKDEAQAYLIDEEHCNDNEVKDFIKNAKKEPGWHTSKERVKAEFDKWKTKDDAKVEVVEEKKEKKEEKKEEKEEEKKAPPPAVAPPKKPVFTLNAKIFDSIKNTKPRLEFRRILKTFFEELSILNYGNLPGDFVQAVNALKLPAVGNATNENEDELRSLLSSFKTNMSKREEPKETVVKLKVVPKAPKKKAAVKKVKKAPAATKGTVRKVVKVKAVKKNKEG